MFPNLLHAKPLSNILYTFKAHYSESFVTINGRVEDLCENSLDHFKDAGFES
jgi:hypothetical protein